VNLREPGVARYSAALCLFKSAFATKRSMRRVEPRMIHFAFEFSELCRPVLGEQLIAATQTVAKSNE
jgi:hypothetical protein